MRFPPVLNRAHFERSGFLKSFPHLAGTIHSFAGNERAHRELLRAVEAGRRLERGVPAGAGRADAGRVLSGVSALAGTLPAAGRLVDVMSYCFRHEPSDDAGRMQMFRMHEHVRAADAGDRDRVARDVARPRASRFVDALGLDARADVASDPFFGRGGKLLAESQRDQRLKLEIVAPIASDEQPDRDHLAQLPSGSLRRSCSASRRPTARSRTRRASGSASSGSRWRSTAATASTAPRGRQPVREALEL